MGGHQLLDGVVASADCLRAVREVFSCLRNEVIAGQYLEMLVGSTTLGGDRRAGEEAALAVAQLKSARYTVTRPLELGAALGGPLEPGSPTLGALRAYGDSDRVHVPDPRRRARPVRGASRLPARAPWRTYREGKRTVLLERALRLAAPADVEHLMRSAGNAELSDADAERCRDIVARSGALASVEALIASQHRTAIDALGGIDGSARAALVELAHLAVEREA